MANIKNVKVRMSRIGVHGAEINKVVYVLGTQLDNNLKQLRLKSTKWFTYRR